MGASIKHSGGYRPEIDGLRAVAVVSVVIYHINKAWLPGGYVGVDIFFVISGFLITSIIWRELQAGSFSLANFYLRRIRRIIPVMLVVVATTLLAGAFLLLPEALERLSLSAIFSVASAANIYFWRYLDDDYFAEASDQEPLLHLWSLGVEEQFYLVWPLLLLLVRAVRKNGVAVAILVAMVLAVASFAIAEATNESNPKFSYFMLPARAGELMVGALLALSLRKEGVIRKPANWLVTEVVGVVGLAAIGYSVFFLDDLSPFPGLNALYSCVGAALIILAGDRSRLLQWLLANKPMVWIGLISYSLYLWHWPILAFIRYFFGTVGAMHAAVAVVAMFALSVLSYRYVERPTRAVRWRGGRQVVLLFIVPAACLAIPAAMIVKSDGLKVWVESSSAYQEGLQRLNGYTAPAYRFKYNCQLGRHDPRILVKARCLVGSSHPAAGAPRVLLWGDSHAAHHVGAIGAIAASAGIQVRNATHSSCPPVFGGEYSYGKYKNGCTQFRRYIREHIDNHEFDVVMLGATWTSYERNPQFRKDIASTVSEIRQSGATVVLLGKVPFFASYNRECDIRWLRVGFSGCNQLVVANERVDINDYLQSLADSEKGVTYLNLGDAICDDSVCRAYMDGKPLYYDKSHLSMDGSRRIGEYMLRKGAAAKWIDAMKVGSFARLRESEQSASPFKRMDLRQPLPKGFKLPFDYHRRFDNTTQAGSDESSQPMERRVMVEYFDVRPSEAEALLLRGLTTKGFTVVDRTSMGRIHVIDLKGDDQARVTLRITQNAKDTKAPDASGILHITWKAKAQD